MNLRRFSIYIVLLWSAMGVKAQMINNIPLKELEVEYLQISEHGTTLSLKKLKRNITVDYGQEILAWKTNTYFLMDNSGNYWGVNSMVEALNLFSSFGFELVEIIKEKTEDSERLHYLLRRKKQ